MNVEKKTFSGSIQNAIIVFFATITTISCVPVYQANSVFVPAFEGKHDIVAEASVGSGDLSINAGYAITDNLALIAGYQNRSPQLKFFTPNYFAEVGPAWYFNQSGNISGEIMGSFGFGKYHYTSRNKDLFSNNYYQRSINAEHQRFALQYNLHFHVRPVTFSLITRWSNVYFNHYDDSSLNEKDGTITAISDSFRRIYIEPVGAITFSIQQISLFAQSGFLLQVGGNTEHFMENPFILNVGLRFRMNHGSKD
jgi:hypothetical protein